MIFFFQPLLHKDDDKHGGHNEFQSLCIKVNQRAEDTAERGAGDPVKLIQQGYEKHEPAAIHIFWDICRVVYRKCFIAHAVDEIDFFPAHTFELVQHGNPVKQMPCVDHQRHSQSLNRIERPHEHIYSDKFDGARKDGYTHEHRVPEAEAGYVHIDAVGESEEPEAGKNGDRMWECGGESLHFYAFFSFHKLIRSFRYM